MPLYHLKKNREIEINEEHRKSLATIKQYLLRATDNIWTAKTRTKICDTLRSYLPRNWMGTDGRRLS